MSLPRLLALFLVILFASAASAQTVPVPNAALAEGDAKPAGWTLTGDGQWHKDAPACLSVKGTGETDSAWQSTALPLKPDTLYRLRFEARSLGASGGTPTSGTPFANRDLGDLPAEWTAFDTVFTTPRAIPEGQGCLRFGQWHANGEVAFRSPELCQAQAVYARQGDLALGDGESLDGNAYTFWAPFGGPSRNHSHPLASYTCTYNSDRWVLAARTEVVYCHRLAGRKITAAEVTASVTWYAHSELVVEAGTDGKTWQPLGTIGKLDTALLAVPASLLPAEALWVRLRGYSKEGEEQKRGMALQVGGYGLKATVDGPAARLAGSTRFVSITAADPKVDVLVEGFGEGLPGGHNQVLLKAKNLTARPIVIEPSTAVTHRNVATITLPGKEYRSDGTDTTPRLNPGENSVELPFEGLTSGGNSVEITLGKNVAFRAEAMFFIADLYNSSFGEALPATSDAVAIWSCSDGWKISRTRPAPERKGDTVALSSAKNGTAAAQVVIRPSGKALKGLTAKAEALKGPGGATIPAEAVEILRVQYVNITQPTDSTGCVGEWPDPLPPLKGPIDCEAGKSQPLWVRVKVPADARAGTYTGRIALAAEGWTANAPLKLEVYDFALPDRMTCQTAFGFEAPNVWRYHNLKDEKDRRAVLEKYLACLAAHHISPYDPAPLDPFKVTWPDKKNLVPAIDWAAWDAAIGRAIDRYHFNSFSIPMVGMGGGTFFARVEPDLLGYKEDTPEYKAAFAAYGRAVEGHLREKGWLPYAFIYWFDEPADKDFAFVTNGFKKLKATAPDLTRMLTKEPRPDLVGGPNLWCPIENEFRQGPADERMKAGERFWWYVCCGPKAPYPTLFIDHPATELRVWLWQTWQRKIDGILIWSTNYWTSDAAYPDPAHPQNPYADPASWTSGYGTPKGAKNLWGNGDGRFLYPPEAAADGSPAGPVLDGPVASIRLEMLRDGIEDYEYLVILRDLLAKRGAKLSEKERADFASLLAVPPEITKDATTFTKDPAPMEARRHGIAKAIEGLMRR